MVGGSNPLAPIIFAYSYWRKTLEKVRVGVIGVGNLGQHHARIYSRLPEAALVGVVDINKEKAVTIANKYNTTPYVYYGDLFDKVDAVSIVVPTSLHYKIALDFIERGINVLIEKPVTSTLDEAMKLVRVAKVNKVILQVGHIERFNKAFLALKDIIKEPIYIESHRLGPFSPRVVDVGVVLDLMIHDIDIITSIVGSKVEKVEAFGSSVYTDKEDIASAQLMFSNGTIANIVASRISSKKARKLEIMERNRAISLDYISQELYVYTNSRENGNGSSSKVKKIDIEWEEPLKLELEHFLRCITNGERPVVGIEEGVEALEIAFRILNKIKLNQNPNVSFLSYAPYSKEDIKSLHQEY